MSFHFADIARHAAADSTISDAEILELRRAGWADGRMSRVEAEAVFSAQHAITDPSAAWSDFFVEAISNYVLKESQPHGYASEEEASWLIGQVETDGGVCSMTEFELLSRIAEKAKNVPESLKSWILATLECEVLTGVGPTRCGGELSDKHVTEAECRIIRRVIFGQASDRPAAVSQREAEMMFRIKNATLESANAPEFKRLFVQSVGNYLMGFCSDNAQISAARMLELEAFLADNKASVGRFMGQMAKSAPNAFGVVFGRKTNAGDAREERMAEQAQVTAGERDWLDAQMEANGQIDSYDAALIDFLAEEVEG